MWECFCCWCWVGAVGLCCAKCCCCGWDVVVCCGPGTGPGWNVTSWCWLFRTCWMLEPRLGFNVSFDIIPARYGSINLIHGVVWWTHFALIDPYPCLSEIVRWIFGALSLFLIRVAEKISFPKHPETSDWSIQSILSSDWPKHPATFGGWRALEGGSDSRHLSQPPPWSSSPVSWSLPRLFFKVFFKLFFQPFSAQTPYFYQNAYFSSIVSWK